MHQQVHHVCRGVVSGSSAVPVSRAQCDPLLTLSMLTTPHTSHNCQCTNRFITFAEESSVAAVFGAGSMQEIAGKRVEVKAATPKGSGPVGRGPAMGAMAGRGGMGYAGYPPRGMMPGRYPGDYGWAMHPGGSPLKEGGQRL
jgi:hypothetical protein